MVCQPANLRKHLRTKRMAEQRLEICQKYRHWTTEDWSKVIFSDESMFLQFASYKPFVRRPSGSSPIDFRYVQATVKQPPAVMVWGCFSTKGREGLYFLAKGKTMNALLYIKVLGNDFAKFYGDSRCYSLST